MVNGGVIGVVGLCDDVCGGVVGGGDDCSGVNVYGEVIGVVSVCDCVGGGVTVVRKDSSGVVDTVSELEIVVGVAGGKGVSSFVNVVSGSVFNIGIDDVVFWDSCTHNVVSSPGG